MGAIKKGTARERNEFIWRWAFIFPTMLGLIVLNIIPIFQTIYQSFFKTGDFGRGNIFIGLDNYVKMFGDAEVWQSVINTFKYAIVEVPFSIAIALVLAVLLNRKMMGVSAYRTIFFVTITRVIGGLQVFDQIFMVIDKNNPALYKTQSIVYLFYQNSFVENNKGYGSTIVVLLIAIIMVVTVFQMIAQKKWVYYN